MGKNLKKIGKTSGKPMGNNKVLDAKTEKHFTDMVLEADKPAIVDFWAPWCQPCKMMAPIFDKAAGKYQGEVNFVKVNTEASPSIAKAFNISSIPTLLVFHQGKIFDARVGLTSAGQLDTVVQRVLDKHNNVGLVGKVKRMFGGDKPQAESAQA